MSIDELFADFHRKYPQVLVELEASAAKLLQHKCQRIGIKCIWENLRYESNIRTSGRGYKLSNSLTSRYARLMIERNPSLRSVIETRPLKGERGVEHEADDAYELSAEELEEMGLH